MITDVAKSQRQQDIERILQSIRPSRASSAALVVLVGLPGTGKTHLARELSRRTGAAVVESDACRRLLIAERRYTRGENRRLFAAIHGAIDELLAQHTQVIVDATSLHERDREPLYELARRRAAKLTLVLVTAADETVWERLHRRPSEETHSEADFNVYDRMRGRMEQIRRPHLVVDTSANIEPALRALTKEMMQRDQ